MQHSPSGANTFIGFTPTRTCNICVRTMNGYRQETKDLPAFRLLKVTGDLSKAHALMKSIQKNLLCIVVVAGNIRNFEIIL